MPWRRHNTERVSAPKSQKWSPSGSLNNANRIANAVTFSITAKQAQRRNILLEGFILEVDWTVEALRNISPAYSIPIQLFILTVLVTKRPSF